MKLFVWDFHGVLEQNNELAVLEITNSVLSENHSSKRMTKEQCYDFYGLKWYEYFSRIDSNLSLDECLRLQEYCFTKSISNPNIVAKHISQTPGADKVLSQIDVKHKQILISNTDPESLILFIKAVGLDKYFVSENTYPVNSHREHTRTKKQVLSEYLAHSGTKYDELITIGDSPSDIELTTLYPRSKSYLYTHPNRAYKNCKADYKTHNLLDILREI